MSRFDPDSDEAENPDDFRFQGASGHRDRQSVAILLVHVLASEAARLRCRTQAAQFFDMMDFGHDAPWPVRRLKSRALVADWAS